MVVTLEIDGSERRFASCSELETFIAQLQRELAEASARTGRCYGKC